MATTHPSSRTPLHQIQAGRGAIGAVGEQSTELPCCGTTRLPIDLPSIDWEVRRRGPAHRHEMVGAGGLNRCRQSQAFFLLFFWCLSGGGVGGAEVVSAGFGLNSLKNASLA